MPFTERDMISRCYLKIFLCFMLPPWAKVSSPSWNWGTGFQYPAGRAGFLTNLVAYELGSCWCLDNMSQMPVFRQQDHVAFKFKKPNLLSTSINHLDISIWMFCLHLNIQIWEFYFNRMCGLLQSLFRFMFGRSMKLSYSYFRNYPGMFPDYKKNLKKKLIYIDQWTVNRFAISKSCSHSGSGKGCLAKILFNIEKITVDK